MKKKLIVILGPTASGKSELAVELAKKFNGEIISVDSRQIYKKMDIGTGKVTPDTKNSSNFSTGQSPVVETSFTTGQAKKKYIFTHKGIPHYCIDIASPKRRFTVVQYRKLALKSINKIFRKGKIPILCGGTGFYIQAVIDGIIIPEVKPNWRLRSNLNKLETEKLLKLLKKLDPKRAKTIEKNNPRRLIRAIEIVIKTGGPVPSLKKKPLPYPVLIIGIKKEKEELKKLIKKRFINWLKRGLIKEVKNLKKYGLSWKKIEEFGIHYRVITQYLQKKINRQEMIENSIKEIQNYAKRQMTWFTRQNFAKQNLGGFKRDKRIHWTPPTRHPYRWVRKIVKKFLERK